MVGKVVVVVVVIVVVIRVFVLFIFVQGLRIRDSRSLIAFKD